MRKLNLISIVVPAYNEAKNLPILYQRLVEVMENQKVPWELIIVDDHSRDDTFSVIEDLARQDKRVSGYRLSRNFGSHRAIWCGLDHAHGDCAVAVAADLQDPPEVIRELLTQWQEGAQVVWGARRAREGEKSPALGLSSRLYYFIMRWFVGMREMPATGADLFLIDRSLINDLRQFSESHVSIFALITWMGFRQETVFYQKRARAHGRSGWSLGKKIELALDSIISFSDRPIRMITYLGFIFSLCGFIYAGFVVANAFIGNPVQGWSSLMVVVLVLGGFQMLMMGILGEYLWRALDETRQRPRYLIERSLPE